MFPNIVKERSRTELWQEILVVMMSEQTEIIKNKSNIF